MNRTVLNVDVLLLVFSLAHKQTQLALMSTTRVLYREGGKQLLKDMDGVWLGTEPRLESFLLFMDADGGSRMRYLHRLILDINLNLSRPVAKRFKNMLNRLAPVSRLTDLSILHLEPLLSAHPFLSKAIANLTSIKTIDLFTVGKRSVKMLKSMQSELETVEFGGFDDQLIQSSKPDDPDLIMLLRPFSSSLRSLTVAGWCATVDPQDDAPQYPLLSALTLDEPTSPTTWHYSRAFPNLKCLTIMTTGFVTAEERLDEFHQANVAQLRRHGCWESLDWFEGPILELWLLGLLCPVSKLNLHDECYPVTPDILRGALVPARATQLRVSFYQFGLFRDEDFIRAFVEGCGATLKVLDLTIKISLSEYDEVGYDLDLGDVLDAITDMLRSFSTLESVTLELHFERCDWGKDEELPGEVFAEDMDVDAMCAALHEAVPSASHVRFELQDHKTRGNVTTEIGSEEKK
ncbi:hypothetical protein GSI_00018 [Ganoderma sinense ZZ0214-1]|uniref:F-box domain-containing protein n=1 Tax=Ganoderma sinense ZZ0214-1 TaxID=1077348 RepID=A0A2G8SRE6_9APHY|nr:hypothetical protein GSI_00018 [Ganoderma sinense ZZ0214-1]